MYSFISIDKIITFFTKYGIDITLFTNYELSILIILSNILVVISYIFIIYISYKIILKVLNWWF